MGHEIDDKVNRCLAILFGITIGLFVALFFLLLASAAHGQTIYNPTWVEWESTETVTRYTLELIDASDSAVVVTAAFTTAEREAVSAGVWRVALAKLAAIPVGRTWKVRLVQCDDTLVDDGKGGQKPRGCSEPSNYTLNTVRYQPCVASSKLVVPSLTPVLPIPSPKKGAFATFQWAWTGPSAVRQLRMDLVGDGAPAWYFAVPAATTAESPQVVVVTAGPFPRAGNFALEAWAVDAVGCEAALGFGRRVVVQP